MTSDSVAVIAGQGGIAVVADGEVLPVVSSSNGGQIFVARIDDTKLAMTFDDQLAVVDVRTGDAQVRPCSGGCDGIAAWKDQLYTVHDDFTLYTYGLDLALSSKAQLDHVPEPNTNNSPDPSLPYPHVIGVLDGRIVVQHTTTLAYRSGPMGLVFYEPDTTVVKRIEVPGNFSRASLTPDGEHLLVAGWGSGGACYTSTSLSVVSGEGSVTTLPLKDREKPDYRSLWITGTQWWGDTLVLTGLYEGNDDAGGGDCLDEAVGYTWTAETGLVPRPAEDFVAYLDDGCSLGLTQSRGVSELSLVDGDTTRPLTGYNTIVHVPSLARGCFSDTGS